MTGAALGRAIGRSERYGRLLLAEFRAAEQESSQNGACRRVPRAALDEYVERLRREAVA